MAEVSVGRQERMMVVSGASALSVPEELSDKETRAVVEMIWGTLKTTVKSCVYTGAVVSRAQPNLGKNLLVLQVSFASGSSIALEELSLVAGAFPLRIKDISVSARAGELAVRIIIREMIANAVDTHIIRYTHRVPKTAAASAE